MRLERVQEMMALERVTAGLLVGFAEIITKEHAAHLSVSGIRRADACGRRDGDRRARGGRRVAIGAPSKARVRDVPVAGGRAVP